MQPSLIAIGLASLTVAALITAFANTKGAMRTGLLIGTLGMCPILYVLTTIFHGALHP
jgi:hypothetical protein